MRSPSLRLVGALAGAIVLLAAGPGGTAGASPETTRYVVVLAGTATEEGFALAGTQQAVAALVTTAGGTVTRDLSKQIGVLAVESPNALFDEDAARVGAGRGRRRGLQVEGLSQHRGGTRLRDDGRGGTGRQRQQPVRRVPGAMPARRTS
jgi:hypothetical protein